MRTDTDGQTGARVEENVHLFWTMIITYIDDDNYTTTTMTIVYHAATRELQHSHAHTSVFVKTADEVT